MLTLQATNPVKNFEPFGGMLLAIGKPYCEFEMNSVNNFPNENQGKTLSTQIAKNSTVKTNFILQNILKINTFLLFHSQFEQIGTFAGCECPRIHCYLHLKVTRLQDIVL